MLESISLFEEIFTYINMTVRGDAPWWIYFILVLIPICILVAIREGFCWFFKVNKMAKKLERIDRRLMVINGSIEEIVMIMKHEIQRSKIHPGKAQDNRSDTAIQLGDETSKNKSSEKEFTMEEKPWSK
jgi:hypothetical protein